MSNSANQYSTSRQLNRRHFLGTASTAVLGGRSAKAAPEQQPNIVLIYTDDLGYGDLGCFGHPEIKTPHIDRIASEGVKLTSFYAAPVCCPSRAGLLTGRYPQRVGMLSNVRNDMTNSGHLYKPLEYTTSPEMTQGLDLREVTIAQRLKDAGYATGIVGKWDSGRKPEFLPLQRGFDFFFGFANTGVDYWTHERYGVPSMFRGNERIKEEGYATNLFRREAIRFIDRNKDRPFFLYLPFNAPHSPSNLERTGPQAPDEYIRLYGEPPGTNRMRYLANISCLDAAVEAVLERLRHHGLDENTLVVFSSDNGAGSIGRNLPFRGTKGSMHEGGIRVPFIARWPGRLPKEKESSEFCSTLDLCRTLLQIAGAQVSSGPALDGYDIWSVLSEGGSSPRQEQFWELRGSRAARVGKWKWVLKAPRFTIPPEDALGELYDLENDPGEKRDLGQQKPEILRDLKARSDAWMNEMARSEPRGPFASREYFRLLGFPQ